MNDSNSSVGGNESRRNPLKLTGKVARVNSDRELVINRGATHGVLVGHMFRIKASPVSIEDPDTHQEIGHISPVKVVVRVSDVDEQFCIARTFRTRTVNVGGNFGGSGINSLSSLLQPPKYETRVETLRRSPDEAYLSAKDSIVRVGDPVEAIDSDEDADSEPSATVWR